MVVKPVVQWKNPLLRISGYLIFFPFSLGVWAVAAVRDFLYHHRLRPIVKSKTPVVCVGSVTAGGSGKTPVVEYLAIALAQAGKRVAVVSNGYKKKSKGLTLVSDGRTLLQPVERCGDEALLLAENFIRTGCAVPVIAGSDREAAATFLEKNFAPEIILLDDGFQYRRLEKTLSLVIVDYHEQSYPRLTVPLGRLREPFYRIHNADMVLIAKCPDDIHEFPVFLSKQVFCSYPISSFVNYANGETLPLDAIQGRAAIVFAGLGFHESFRESLENLCRTYGAALKRFIEFQDHHWYTRRDIERLTQLAAKENAVMVTTAKDAVKLKKEWLGNSALWVAAAELVFRSEENKNLLMENIYGVLNRKSINATALLG